MEIEAETDESGLGADTRSPPFDVWVAPHLRTLSAVAIRLVGVDDAADLVQETLLRAWRKRATYSPERGELRAWLIAILVDQIRRYRVRHMWRRPAPVASTDDVGSVADVAEGRSIDVDAAVRSLAFRQQQAVVLYYFADLSVTDVGAAMGVSAGTVKAHLAAARVRLRDLLEQA